MRLVTAQTFSASLSTSTLLLLLLVEVDFAPLKRVELGILRVGIVTLHDPMALHCSVIGEGLLDSTASIAAAITTAISTATRVTAASAMPTSTIHRYSIGIPIANLTPLSQAYRWN